MSLVELFEKTILNIELKILGNYVDQMEGSDRNLFSPKGYVGDLHQVTNLKCFCGGKIAVSKYPLGTTYLYGVYCHNCMRCFVDGETKDKIQDILRQNFVP